MNTTQYNNTIARNILCIQAILDEYRTDPNCPPAVILRLEALVSELEAFNNEVSCVMTNCENA